MNISNETLEICLSALSERTADIKKRLSIEKFLRSPSYQSDILKKYSEDLKKHENAITQIREILDRKTK